MIGITNLLDKIDYTINSLYIINKTSEISYNIIIRLMTQQNISQNCQNLEATKTLLCIYPTWLEKYISYNANFKFPFWFLICKTRYSRNFLLFLMRFYVRRVLYRCQRIWSTRFWITTEQLNILSIIIFSVLFYCTILFDSFVDYNEIFVFLILENWCWI